MWFGSASGDGHAPMLPLLATVEKKIELFHVVRPHLTKKPLDHTEMTRLH